MPARGIAWVIYK